MNYAVFLLGFIFNIGFLLEALRLPISRVSLVYWVVLLVLLFLGKVNNIRIPKSYIAFIIVFFSYYTLSFFFFPKTEYSNYKYLMVLVKLPALILIPFFISTNRNYFFSGYVSSLILILFILLAQSGSLLTSSTPDVNTRLEVEGLNPIWISRLVLETMLITGIILKLKKKYFLLLLFACIPILYASGSKGPILSYLISLTLYKLKKIKFNFQKIIILGCAVIGVGASTIFVLSRLDENSYIIQRFFRAVPDASSEEIKEMSRVIVWPMTIEKAKESPLISIMVGYGVGNFSNFYTGSFSNERFYPHNFFLELLIEQGLPFMLFFGISFFYFFKKSRNNFKYILLFYFMNAMFSGDILLNDLLFFYLSFALVNKSVPNENTLSHIRKLSESTNNSITSYKSI